jgi:hypothetical protein
MSRVNRIRIDKHLKVLGLEIVQIMDVILGLPLLGRVDMEISEMLLLKLVALMIERRIALKGISVGRSRLLVM